MIIPVRRRCDPVLSAACATGLAIALSAAITTDARAAEPAAQRSIAFHIPAMPLDQALLEFSRQSGLSLAATGNLRGAAPGRPVHGAMSADAGLRQLLQGSGFGFLIQSDGLVQVRRIDPPSPPAPPQAAAASTAAAPAALDLGRITVTARRREELRVDVPITVSLLQGEDIDALGLASASEALRLLPGVTTVDGGTALTQVQIRGVSSSLGGNDNGYYLDEVPFTGVTVPWHPDTRAFDLERVEVLKGPQGALFGEGSMGGTVRILTRAPELDAFAARVELGGERSAGGAEGSLARAMANIPLVEGKLALRVAATHESLPPWIIDGRSDSSAINRHRIDTSRVRLRWQAGRWITDLSHLRSSHESPRGGYSADDRQVAGSDMDTAARWQGSSVTSTVDLGATRLTLLAATAQLAYDAGGWFTQDVQADFDIGIDVDNYEARWSSAASGRIDWVLGYARRVSTRRDRVALAPLLAQSQQDNTANALFADVTVASADQRWSGSAGMRYFHDRVHARTSTDGRDVVLSSTFARLNPKLSLSHHLSPRRKLHASVSTGFRSGQLQPADSLLAGNAAAIELPESIHGDSILSYELGYTHAATSGRRLLQAALFRSHWSDLPVRVPINGVQNGLVNSSGARIDGIELGLGFLPVPRLKLDLGGTFVNARYSADTPGTPLRAGTPVYNVPRTSLFAAASYRRPLGEVLTALASAHVSHHSPRSTGLIEGAGGDAITQLALRVGVEAASGWAGHLYAENLLDERGAVDGRDLAGNATRLRPRTLGAELRFAF